MAEHMLFLEWTENRKPNSEISYDHCLVETPFGRISVEWKSWKDYDSPCILEHPVASIVGTCGNDVDHAKYLAEEAYFNALQEQLDVRRNALHAYLSSRR